jgi:hypothetical protein
VPISSEISDIKATRTIGFADEHNLTVVVKKPLAEIETTPKLPSILKHVAAQDGLNDRDPNPIETFATKSPKRKKASKSPYVERGSKFLYDKLVTPKG